MDSSLTDISREILEEFISPRASQIMSGHNEALLPQTPYITPSIENSAMIGRDIPLSITAMETHEDDGRTGTSGFTITRREILNLTKVLERSPQEYVTREEAEVDQTLRLTIIDGPEQPLTMTSSQDDVGGLVPATPDPNTPRFDNTASSGMENGGGRNIRSPEKCSKNTPF